MIYSIGIRLKYDRAFAGGTPVIKLGLGDDGYAGGFVWQTAEEATRFLAAKGLSFTHVVMGVLADWETDTEQHPGEPYRHLTREAEFVKLSW